MISSVGRRGWLQKKPRQTRQLGVPLVARCSSVAKSDVLGQEFTAFTDLYVSPNAENWTNGAFYQACARWIEYLNTS